jgi:hypothetical protein
MTDIRPQDWVRTAYEEWTLNAGDCDFRLFKNQRTRQWHLYSHPHKDSRGWTEISPLPNKQSAPFGRLLRTSKLNACLYLNHGTLADDPAWHRDGVVP